MGKIRLRLSPPANHWRQVPLLVTARGLTTSAVPYGQRTFQIDFDFIDYGLIVRTGEGDLRALPLAPQPCEVNMALGSFDLLRTQ